MENLPEFVGTVHIFLGPYRGNPIALYLRRDSSTCQIAPQIYPWSRTVGTGENPNKAAADFEEKWKQNGLSSDMYTGPHWEGGIKPEKPKPAAAQKPPAAPTTPTPETAGTASTSTPPPADSEKAKDPPASTTQETHA